MEDAEKQITLDAGKARMRAQLDSLHSEVEIAEYATEKSGLHSRRKLPRKVSLVRTKKRKQLEKVDREQHAISIVEEEGEHSKRFRGAKMALEDEFIHGNFTFEREHTDVEEGDEIDEADDVDTDEDGVDNEEDIDASQIYDELAPDVGEDEEDYVEGDGDLVDDAPEDHVVTAQHDQIRKTVGSVVGETRVPKKTIIGNTSKKKKRTMHRLRGFKSFRMAQRHGDALGAHARGLPKAAIRKLGNVADDAPAAPQVYSSLGMVYENKLKEYREREENMSRELNAERNVAQISGNSSDLRGDTDHRKASVLKQVYLAKKAYGSYHVAALLCKKDFTLWVRAADTAMEIVDLYSQMMELSFLVAADFEDSRNEKKKWMEDAKQDYALADNLRPPGIDIPAKLATVHIELGNFSEAMTILTDLKNQAQSSSASLKKRSELEGSFRIWLLYSHFMLRIGHECLQWNRGIETNDNYMFRRWLRKYSENFDWRERRLQALCLALEAAAGSKSCTYLTEWTKKRSSVNGKLGSSTGIIVDDRWHVDSHKITNTTSAVSNAKNAREGEIGQDGKETCTSKRVTSLAGETFHEMHKEKTNSTGDEVDCEISLPRGNGSTVDRVSWQNRVDNEYKVDSECEKSDRHLSPTKDDSSVVQTVASFAYLSPERLTILSLSEEFDRKKQLLISTNLSSLDAYDKTTKNMHFDNASVDAQKRQDTRADIVKSQKVAIVNLVGDFYQQQSLLKDSKGHETNQFEEESLKSRTRALLPISASCATVCRIASELMKHCVELGLYEGSILAGEAVSSYFRERVALSERNLAARNAFDRKQQSTEESVLLTFEHYDQIVDGEDESGDEYNGDLFLSDDDDIDARTDENLFKSLKGGSLPPELRVLYGTSLLGQGGRNYIASKCLEDIHCLELESKTGVLDQVIDTNIVQDPEWQIFRRAKIDPLQQTSAVALVADAICKKGKAKEMSVHLSGFFQTHLDFMETHGLLEELALTADNQSFHASLKKSEALKIVLAAARMKFSDLDQQLTTLPIDPVPENIEEAMRRALSAILLVSKYYHLIWSVSTSSAVSSSNIEILNVFFRALSVLWKGLSSPVQKRDAQFMEDTSSSLKKIVSFLCGVEIPKLNDTLSESPSTESWAQFPISSDWQTAWQQAVSVRAHNLCVACTVSLFSGWETNEFSIDALRKRDSHKYFGVNIRGQCVAGYVSQEVELELIHQWKQLGSLLSWTSSLDVADRILKAKTTEWYKSAMEKLKSESAHESVSIYGEEDGLKILLALSSLCLFSAQASTNAAKDAFIKTSLSVLLPVSQLCFGEKIWDTSIGTKAIPVGRSRMGDWQQHSDRKALSDRRQLLNKKLSQQRKTAKAQARAATRSIANKKKGLLTDFVRIPASFLKVEWKAGDTTEGTHLADSVHEAMQNVDDAMRQLRTCFTVGALEKSSLQVAKALLELVDQDACSNPFLCIQQAVIFASQGQKQGSSDEYFKKPIATVSDCTPLEAIAILGRADCFQAVHFPNQALFLCSHVAQVCSLHREDPNSVWNAQWRIVGILAYNVSITIKKTMASSALKLGGRKVTRDSWDKDVAKELERGRADALTMARNFNILNVAAAETDEGAVVDEGEEDAPPEEFIQVIEVVKNEGEYGNDDWKVGGAEEVVQEEFDQVAGDKEENEMDDWKTGALVDAADTNDDFHITEYPAEDNNDYDSNEEISMVAV